MTDATGRGLTRPLVSVGVPVYNGERFLGRALDSLLGQTLADCELIISDNASVDGTQAICEAYARRDGRVRYVRQPVNIGGPRNWNAVLQGARGVFFKWASASDYCAPSMVEKCVRVMQAEPDVVVCHGLTQLVEEDEHPIEVFQGDTSFDEARPSERFRRVLEAMTLNNAQSGVIRLDVLRRTRLERLYPSGDMALMAELALYGKFRLIPEVLLYRRQSPGTFTALLSPEERRRFLDPRTNPSLNLVRTKRHLDNLVSIARAPLPLVEKLRTFQVALRLARWERGTIWRELQSLVGRSGGTA